LNHIEAARIAALRPRQEALLKRPDVAKVIELNVETESRWMYSNATSPSEPLDSIEPVSHLVH
jgi:hypothetical protein